MQTIISSRLAALRAKQIISMQGYIAQPVAIAVENLMQAKSLADIATHAARKMKSQGRYAMARYAMKRGVSAELLILAMRLENGK